MKRINKSSSLSTVMGSILSLAAVLLLFSGCKEEAPTVSSPEVHRNVRILEMTSGEMTEYFEISGPVAPVQGTNLSSQESGQVIRLAATKGTVLSRGDVILELDRGILKAEMKAAESNFETQSYNVDKVRKLNKAGKLSRMELLTAESAYQQAKSMAAVTKKRYERAIITAPFDGVIVERFVELGQLVQPGQPVVRLIDPSVLKVEAYLTDQEVSWVKTGTTAEVMLQGQDQTVLGTVSWVALEA
ncbi:MAG: efflux RND transporter periplasmic adaptor subunit, partial [bacterium]|nr:efflux RND transporter periplasmic adaptor subunit [bacterium]